MNEKLETVESTLLRGRVKLIQPKHGFRASIDSVLLASAVKVTKQKAKVLDVGCGVGSAGLCITFKNPSILLTGIDIQDDLVGIAKQNAKLNNIDAEFVCGDIKKEKTIKNNHFDNVLMNPPYEDEGLKSPNKIKATSHNTCISETTLEDWIKYLHLKLKQGGTATIIHKAEKADQIILHLTKRRWFGSIVLYPLYPHKGDDAKRVIIRARKERYKQMVIKSGLVLHKENGDYTDEAEAIFSDGAGIDLG